MARETHTARDGRNAPFFWIDNAVIDAHGKAIGPMGIAVYCTLARYANAEGRAFPSLQTILDHTGIKSKNSVRAVLDTLEARGLITIDRRTMDGTTSATSHRYTLCTLTDTPPAPTPDAPPRRTRRREASATDAPASSPVAPAHEPPTLLGTSSRLPSASPEPASASVALAGAPGATEGRVPSRENHDPPSSSDAPSGAGGGGDSPTASPKPNRAPAGATARALMWLCPTMSATSAQQFDALDECAVRASVENALADGLSVGAIVKKLRVWPPAHGDVWPREQARKRNAAQLAMPIPDPEPPPTATDRKAMAAQMRALRLASSEPAG